MPDLCIYFVARYCVSYTIKYMPMAFSLFSVSRGVRSQRLTNFIADRQNLKDCQKYALVASDESECRALNTSRV